MWNLIQIKNSSIIINATNIGRRSSGIGIYTLNLLKEIACKKSNLKFIVYLNKSCAEEIQKIQFPEHITLKWVSSAISPDNLFKGHLLRLLYSNYLSLKHPKSLMVVTSQLEACFFRSRQVITVHDIIPLLFKQHHKKQYYYFRYLLKMALKKARKIITPSNHTRMMLQKYYNVAEDKIHTIPNGTQRFNENGSARVSKVEEKFILYVGRLCPMKNVTSLLKAFYLLHDKIPHRLIICGDGKDYLAEAVRDGELSRPEFENERVDIVGYVSDATIFDLYKKASLFIFPSFAEGFGLPPLESMSLGCPVVTSHTESLPEVCGDAAYYIDPYDINTISEGIYQVLMDKSLRNNLIRKGYKRAALFSWQKSADAHLKVIQETISPYPGKVIHLSQPVYPLPHLSNKVAVD
ncbi:MAG: glycosyltransferase family 4 protein [bacterium]|nr:MAG: glycosyltransferase family 4 protein [bacterium]